MGRRGISFKVVVVELVLVVKKGRGGVVFVDRFARKKSIVQSSIIQNVTLKRPYMPNHFPFRFPSYVHQPFSNPSPC